MEREGWLVSSAVTKGEKLNLFRFVLSTQRVSVKGKYTVCIVESSESLVAPKLIPSNIYATRFLLCGFLYLDCHMPTVDNSRYSFTFLRPL